MNKKISFPRFITHWFTWAFVGLLSLGFYLGVWPLVYHLVILPRAVPERHGLQVSIFNRLELKGIPLYSYLNISDKLTLKNPYSSLLAYGLWKVPQTGHYRIHMECDDFGGLTIDRQDLIQLNGINARNVGEAEVELTEGYHLIILRLFNKPEQGWLTLNTIGQQKNDSLLNGTSLVYLNVPNLNTWLNIVKSTEKIGLILIIFSLSVFIFLAFIHPGRHQVEGTLKKQLVEKICFEISPFSTWIPFFIIFPVNLYLFLTFPYKDFWGDSLSYWLYTGAFISNGHFSLFNFQDLLRSYLFSLLLWIPRLFSMLIEQNVVTGFRLFSAFLSALTTTILFPLFFEEVFSIRIKPLNRLLFAGLITFFWFGHLSYPLVDLPALTFLIMGVFLCIRTFKSQSSIWLKGGNVLMAGILLGGTPLFRLNYQYSIYLIFTLVMIKLVIHKIPLINKLVLAGLLILGISMPLSIQAIINKIHYDVYSPYQLGLYTEKNIDINLYSLHNGLILQRADFGGAIGADSVLLPKTQGQAILNKHKILTPDGFGFTMSQYLKLVIHHPFDFAAIYARHLFNGLDIVYPSTYVPDIFRHQMLYRFFNYTLWFLCLSLIWRRGIRFKQDKEKLFLLFIVILPALLTIPTHVEVRYFLPVHILMYACISFWVFLKKEYFRDFLALRPFIAYVCFMVICYTFSSMLFSMQGIILY